MRFAIIINSIFSMLLFCRFAIIYYLYIIILYLFVRDAKNKLMAKHGKRRAQVLYTSILRHSQIVEQAKYGMV